MKVMSFCRLQNVLHEELRSSPSKEGEGGGGAGGGGYQNGGSALG